MGYLLLISCDVDDPGEAGRILWTSCWTFTLLIIHSILRNTTLFDKPVTSGKIVSVLVCASMFNAKQNFCNISSSSRGNSRSSSILYCQPSSISLSKLEVGQTVSRVA